MLAMIRHSGVEPHIIRISANVRHDAAATDPIATARDCTGSTVRQILREKGAPYHDLGLGDLSLSDDALLDAIDAHPILMNKPLVVTPKGVRLCRPSETVLGLLPAQRGQFIKEDGERVVYDAAGRTTWRAACVIFSSHQQAGG